MWHEYLSTILDTDLGMKRTGCCLREKPNSGNGQRHQKLRILLAPYSWSLQTWGASFTGTWLALRNIPSRGDQIQSNDVLRRLIASSPTMIVGYPPPEQRVQVLSTPHKQRVSVSHLVVVSELEIAMQRTWNC